MASSISYSTLYPNTHIKGFEEVMNNLNAELSKIKGGTRKGLIMAMAFIRNDTEKSLPLTPVDIGNLRASWFAATAAGKVADDTWNRGFRNMAGKGIKNRSRADASRMSADHIATIAEAQAMCAAELEKGIEQSMMGYSANYAVYIHENFAAKFKRPGAGPKWFEASVNRNRDKIVQILRDNAQIK